MKQAQWFSEGIKRFGNNLSHWKVVCPVCKTVISGQDYKDAGASIRDFALKCIGRFKKDCQKAFGDYKLTEGEPCDYTSSGLLNVSPVEVDCDGTILHAFNFYDEEK